MNEAQGSILSQKLHNVYISRNLEAAQEGERFRDELTGHYDTAYDRRKSLNTKFFIAKVVAVAAACLFVYLKVKGIL